MTEDFSLEAILTFTTGISLVDDFNETFHLACFIFNDDNINTVGLVAIKDELKKHLLKIHPQLIDVKYDKSKNLSLTSWLISQKSKFGEKLPVCRINEELEMGSKIGSR